jgi:hypothetical protein
MVVAIAKHSEAKKNICHENGSRRVNSNTLFPIVTGNTALTRSRTLAAIGTRIIHMYDDLTARLLPHSANCDHRGGASHHRLGTEVFPVPCGAGRSS